MSTLTIDRRFAGPPGSANGGYLGGLLAQRQPSGVPFTVVLRSRAPLDTPLRLRDGGLYHGEVLVAQATTGGFDRAAPEPVSAADAATARSRFPAAQARDSLFATCFVCGTARRDGLGIAPGSVDSARVACPWSPDPAQPVTTALVWAAIDCPGGWALPDMLRRPALLGSMTAVVDKLPEPGEPCVVVGQHHGDDGRKSYAATALFDSEARLLARAEQIWIRLPR